MSPWPRLPVSPDEVTGFGVVEVGANAEIQGFEEKPKTTNFRSPFNPDAWMHRWVSTFSILRRCSSR